MITIQMTFRINCSFLCFYTKHSLPDKALFMLVRAYLLGIPKMCGVGRFVGFLLTYIIIFANNNFSLIDQNFNSNKLTNPTGSVCGYI